VIANGKTVSYDTKIAVTAPSYAPAITSTDKTSYTQLEVITVTGINLKGTITNIDFLPVGGGTTQVRTATSVNTDGTQVTYTIPDDFLPGTYTIVIDVDGDSSEEFESEITITSN
jgi:hypothetical protein